MPIEKRKLGRTGLMVSALGFGGAEIGYEQAPADTVRRLLEGALDAGLNLIDTAECYVDSEELIGKAVAHRRAEFVLTTKCGHLDGTDREDWSRAGVIRSIERSLARLKTDHVDVLQLHSCSREVLERGDAIEGLEEARRRGYTRFIGYSGDGEDARFALESGRFDTLQTSISIADQQSIDLLLPLAREKGVGVIAKRPIANAVWRQATRPQNDYWVTYWERLQELRYPFLTDPERAAATALRFTLAQPGVATAIVGTKNPDRWSANAAVVARGPLPAAEIEQIRARWREVADPGWVGQI